MSPLYQSRRSRLPSKTIARPRDHLSGIITDEAANWSCFAVQKLPSRLQSLMEREHDRGSRGRDKHDGITLQKTRRIERFVCFNHSPVPGFPWTIMSRALSPGFIQQHGHLRRYYSRISLPLGPRECTEARGN